MEWRIIPTDREQNIGSHQAKPPRSNLYRLVIDAPMEGIQETCFPPLYKFIGKSKGDAWNILENKR